MASKLEQNTQPVARRCVLVKRQFLIVIEPQVWRQGILPLLNLIVEESVLILGCGMQWLRWWSGFPDVVSQLGVGYHTAENERMGIILWYHISPENQVTFWEDNILVGEVQGQLHRHEGQMEDLSQNSIVCPGCIYTRKDGWLVRAPVCCCRMAGTGARVDAGPSQGLTLRPDQWFATLVPPRHDKIGIDSSQQH